jgi:hypothetical protein
MTSKERKDKCARAMGRKEAGLTMALMHLKNLEAYCTVPEQDRTQATRSHITTELVTCESHCSKREKVDKRYKNII